MLNSFIHQNVDICVLLHPVTHCQRTGVFLKRDTLILIDFHHIWAQLHLFKTGSGVSLTFNVFEIKRCGNIKHLHVSLRSSCLSWEKIFVPVFFSMKTQTQWLTRCLHLIWMCVNWLCFLVCRQFLKVQLPETTTGPACVCGRHGGGWFVAGGPRDKTRRGSKLKTLTGHSTDFW